MSNKAKDIDLKTRTYYFFSVIINIKNFNADKIKTGKMLYKNILIYYTGYVTVRDS